MDRKLPKSLHTVTVLVALATKDIYQFGAEPDEALQAAVETLHLDDLPDVYGLIDAARKQLGKMHQSTVKPQTHKGVDAPYVGPAAIWNMKYRGSDFS